MNVTIQFTRVDLALLIANNIVFGGCITLLMLGKLNVPLVTLCIVTFGVLISLVGRAYRRVRRSGPPPRGEDR